MVQELLRELLRVGFIFLKVAIFCFIFILVLNFFFGMFGIGPYTIPITVIVVIIYYAVKHLIKSSTDHSERTDYREDSNESPSSEYYQQRETFNNTSQIDKDKLVRSRLERFRLSEDEAEIVFGKAWRNKLGEEHWKLFFTIVMIQAALEANKNNYRKKVFHIIDKVIQITDSVYNEDPKLAKEWESKSETQRKAFGYSYSFIEDWEFFKKHKKSRIEYESDADKSEAYNILGLDITATIEQVKKRFRVLALKWHPDRNRTNKTEAEQMFVKINKAYETIIAAA